jgi:hypothetical protein
VAGGEARRLLGEAAEGVGDPEDKEEGVGEAMQAGSGGVLCSISVDEAADILEK